MAELQVVSSQAPSVVERLVLSDRQWRAESVLGYCVALEHARIVGPSDARVTAEYVARTLDNCRLGAFDTRAYFSAVVRHLRWLRSLPVGASVDLGGLSAAGKPSRPRGGLR
jgi:hypothetical protein